MKIYTINTINFKNDKNNNSALRKKDTPVNVGSNICLVGTPKAYISFGTGKIQEQKRKETITEYLQYKDSIHSILENKDGYKNEAQKRIAALQEDRAYYGWWSGDYKPGKVTKVERLRIEKEEFDKYTKAQEICKKLLKNEEYYKSLINTNDIEIYDKVKNILNKRSDALNGKIAGYSKEKQEIKKILIDPIQRETALGTKEKIPPALLLYGASGCGKTEIAKAIGGETECNVVVFSSTTPKKFAGELKSKLNSAKAYYNEQNNKNNRNCNSDDFKKLSNQEKAEFLASQKSPRTIIIINEIDRYFNFQTEGNSEEVAENNKTMLKGILDHCSEKPNGEYPSDASGVTFIFTSNYPTKVDSEISLRNGKCIRMNIPLPADDDIKDIMKFYIDKENSRIIDAKRTGKLINPINISQFPFDSYLTIVKPDENKGVVTGGCIEAAIKQATINYIDNPNLPINIQLANMLINPKYRIAPEKLEEYKKEIEAMGKMYRDIDEKEELELLKEAEELDMLEDEQSERLKYLYSAIATNQ